jgi:hypothetical protein
MLLRMGAVEARDCLHGLDAGERLVYVSTASPGQTINLVGNQPGCVAQGRFNPVTADVTALYVTKRRERGLEI